MDLKDKLKSLIQQASLYHTQGLLSEAKKKYDQAKQLVEDNKNIKNKQKLLDSMDKKMSGLLADINKVQTADQKPEVSREIQDLIKKQFAFGTDDDAGALEGAIALAKFGQLERALEEFDNLLASDSIRGVAAKNIIRTHLTMTSMERAIKQFRKWKSDDRFKPAELKSVRIFLESFVKRKGVDPKVIDDETAEMIIPENTESARVSPIPVVEKTAKPPKPKKSAIDEIIQDQAPEPELEPELSIPNLMEEELDMDSGGEEEILDISSIGITLGDGPYEGQMIDLDVSFQTGNTISLLISSKDKQLIASLSVGQTLNDVQFYSPVAIFNGLGVITGKSQIESGPKTGDYNIDIKIKSA